MGHRHDGAVADILQQVCVARRHIVQSAAQGLAEGEQPTAERTQAGHGEIKSGRTEHAEGCTAAMEEQLANVGTRLALVSNQVRKWLRYGTSMTSTAVSLPAVTIEVVQPKAATANLTAASLRIEEEWLLRLRRGWCNTVW